MLDTVKGDKRNHDWRLKLGKVNTLLLFGFLCAILCAGCGKSEEPDKSGKEIQAAFEA